MKFQAYPTKTNLAEISQGNAITFAFCNIDKQDDVETVVAVHPFMKCREFFNEFLVKNHHPEFNFSEIYGFDYDYENFAYDLNKTRIVIDFHDAKKRQRFIDNLEFLHNIERANGLELTTYTELTRHTKKLLVQGDKFWVSLCLLTNLYTMVLKWCSLGVAETSFDEFRKKNANISEVSYVGNMKTPDLEYLFSNLQKIETIPHTFVDLTNTLRGIYKIHGQSGIASMTDRWESHPANKTFTTMFVNVCKNTLNFFKEPVCVVAATPATPS